MKIHVPSFGINSTVLAEQIGKAKSYISIMENGGLEYIKMRDFSNLLSTLLPTLGIEFSNEKLSRIAILIDDNDGDMDKISSAIEELPPDKLNYNLLKYEINKQRHYNNMSLSDLERECSISDGILEKIIDKETKDDKLIYVTLKSVFLKLDFVMEKAIDTYLRKIGVATPSDAIITNISDINYCFKIDNDLPYNSSLSVKTWGEYLDYCEMITDPTQEDTKAQWDYEFAMYEKENLRREKFPQTRKQELYNKAEQCYDVLKSLIAKINVDAYKDTVCYERNIETIINLLLTTDGMKIFEFLFSYPLHKLEPKSLKDVLSYIDSKLEYQYITEHDTPAEEPSSLDDCLDEYIHL